MPQAHVAVPLALLESLTLSSSMSRLTNACPASPSLLAYFRLKPCPCWRNHSCLTSRSSEYWRLSWMFNGTLSCDPGSVAAETIGDAAAWSNNESAAVSCSAVYMAVGDGAIWRVECVERKCLKNDPMQCDVWRLLCDVVSPQCQERFELVDRLGSRWVTFQTILSRLVRFRVLWMCESGDEEIGRCTASVIYMQDEAKSAQSR